MAAEYLTITVETAAEADPALNAKAAEGWTVKAAYSPTHFLLERTSAPIRERAVPTPPTGPSRG